MQEAADVDSFMPIATTNVTHIISQSISEDIPGIPSTVHAKVCMFQVLSEYHTISYPPPQFDWARTAEAIIERFGGFTVHDTLGEEDIQSPKNAFTSSLEPHSCFGRLDLYLTPVKAHPSFVNALRPISKLMHNH